MQHRPLNTDTPLSLPTYSYYVVGQLKAYEAAAETAATINLLDGLVF